MWRESDDHHLQQEGPRHPIVMQNPAAEMNRCARRLSEWQQLSVTERFMLRAAGAPDVCSQHTAARKP